MDLNVHQVFDELFRRLNEFDTKWERWFMDSNTKWEQWLADFE